MSIYRSVVLYEKFLTDAQKQQKLSYLLNKDTNIMTFDVEFVFVDEKTRRIQFVCEHKMGLKRSSSHDIVIDYEKLEVTRFAKTKQKEIVYEVNHGMIVGNHVPESIIQASMNLLSNASLTAFGIGLIIKSKGENYNKDISWFLKHCFKLIDAV